MVVEEGNTKYTSRINGEETNSIIQIGEDGEGNPTYTLPFGCNNSVILDGVTSIENSIIADCDNFEKIFMEHASSELTLGSGWSGSATVYYYSETEQAGYWNYDENNNPTLW